MQTTPGKPPQRPRRDWYDLTGASVPVRYAASALLVAASIALRCAILPIHAGYSFLTFYPAVVIAAPLLGAGPGVFCALASVAAADALFLPLGDNSSLRTEFLLPMLVFLATAAFVNLIAHHLRRTAAALRDSEQKLRGLFETASVGFALNALEDGRFLEFNAAFAQMTGYEPDKLRTLTYWHLTPPEFREGEAAALRSLQQAGAYGPYEKEYVRADGTRIPLRLRGQLLELADGRICIWSIVEDIRERKQLERAVLEAANREQLSLGHDLHDGLGQELTGLSMLAAALATQARRGQAVAARELDELEALARRATEACRALSHGLAPLHYADGRLIPALEELVALQRQSFGATIEFRIRELVPVKVSAARAYNLYRIAQEAVTNARRHAAATRIVLTLEATADGLWLEISDDGAGMRSTGTATGIGLGIMRYRAEAIGAQFTITETPGGGTTIRCRCTQDDPAPTAAALTGDRSAQL